MEAEGAAERVAAALAAARGAQAGWAAMPVAARLAVIRRFRRALAAEAETVAATLGGRRPEADTLLAEVLPLADAARFLERMAARLLAPRRPPGSRPVWLAGVRAEVRRDPLGVVLVIGPGNYPLLLPGVQVLQALVAGNAVVVKPAPGGGEAVRALALLLRGAGLPDGLLAVLGEDVADGIAASWAGFDRIVLTGSLPTGRSVAQAAAAGPVPCAMELSGSDAVVVLTGADAELIARSLAYGLRLNGGATCIAPRRVYGTAAMLASVAARLRPMLAAIPPAAVPAPVRARLAALLAEARATGATVEGTPGGADVPAAVGMPPILVTGAKRDLALLREDVFAPVVTLVAVADDGLAEAAVADAPFALGASVFGPRAAAVAVAARLAVGSVTVNDLIVPTADPRLPFGGRRSSGFGVTRGAEGLLEMTAVKAMSVRRGRFRPHLAPPGPGDATRALGLIGLLHGNGAGRAGALRRLFGQGAPQHDRIRSAPPGP